MRLLSAEGRLDDAAQVAAVRIPDGVRETIRHRLEPLPDRSRRLLCTAAVIGREFRIDTLQRVSGCESAELDEALGEAVAGGVIVERPPALGAYSFSHGLIRETLYDDLGPQRRSRLHREVGLALEELYAADPEPRIAELAHHFFVAATAGELTRAIDYSVRAGERALKLVAYEEAADHFERALQAHGLQERADVPAALRPAARARQRAVARRRLVRRPRDVPARRRTRAQARRARPPREGCARLRRGHGRL